MYALFRIKDLNDTNPERTITVLGSLENCKHAESMISLKLRASYESDMAQFIPVSISCISIFNVSFQCFSCS